MLAIFPAAVDRDKNRSRFAKKIYHPQMLAQLRKTLLSIVRWRVRFS